MYITFICSIKLLLDDLKFFRILQLDLMQALKH